MMDGWTQRGGDVLSEDLSDRLSRLFSDYQQSERDSYGSLLSCCSMACLGERPTGQPMALGLLRLLRASTSPVSL